MPAVFPRHIAIAVLIRRALDEPEKRVALITPDRALAARVVAHLRRWRMVLGRYAERNLPGSGMTRDQQRTDRAASLHQAALASTGFIEPGAPVERAGRPRRAEAAAAAALAPRLCCEGVGREFPQCRQSSQLHFYTGWYPVASLVNWAS